MFPPTNSGILFYDVIFIFFFGSSVEKKLYKKLSELLKVLKLPQQPQFSGKSVLLPTWFFCSTNAKLIKQCAEKFSFLLKNF